MAQSTLNGAPASWRKVTLGEIYDIGSSKRVLQKQWKDSGVPFYRAREIVKLARDGFVANDLFISEAHFRELEKAKGVPRPGDLMVSAVGTLGACYAVQPGDRFYFKDASVLSFRPIVPIDPRFMQYAFLWNGFLDQVKSSDGATVGTFTIARAKATEFLLPPLDEQKRIVAALNQAFAALDCARTHAEANLADADELLEAVKAGFLERSEATGRRVSLADVTSIDSTLVDPRRPEFLDMPHLGAGNMISASDTLVDVMTARQEKLKSGKYLFDGTMVLYSKIRPYLRKVARPDFSGVCSADVYPLSPSKELDRNFLFHLLHTKDFTEYAISGSDRAGMPKVNREHLFKYEFGLPPIAAQQEAARKIDSVMGSVDGLKAVLKSKLTDLANLRQSLLQKAFAGELA